MIPTAEIFGYIAMIFLVISFIPKQIRTIRILNFIGCSFFIVYGILLGWKYPLIISNVLIAIIQLYHLFFVKKKPEIEEIKVHSRNTPSESEVK